MLNDDAEIGSGLLSQEEYAWHKIQSVVKHARDRLRGVRTTPGPALKRPDGPFGMDAGDAMNFEAGVRSAEMARFHKAVIEHTEPGIGSVAPIPMTRNKNRQNRYGRQHAAEDNLHETIMTAGEDLPMRSVIQSASMHGSQDDPFLLAKLNAGDRFGFSTARSEAPFVVAPRELTHWHDLLAQAGNGGFDSIVSRAGRRGDAGLMLAQDPVALFEDILMPDKNIGGESPSAAPTTRTVSYGARGSAEGSSGDRLDRRFSVKQYHGEHDTFFERDGRMSELDSNTYQSSTRDVPKRAEVSKGPLARELAALLDRQARLPPSGATGFDPRLTPAWAGQKLPG